jgi:hypothetical protein
VAFEQPADTTFPVTTGIAKLIRDLRERVQFDDHPDASGHPGKAVPVVIPFYPYPLLSIVTGCGPAIFNRYKSVQAHRN